MDYLTKRGRRFIGKGMINRDKIAYKTVVVNVTAAASTGSSAADPDLVGGEVIGCVPSGNQDQFVDNIVLNADGSVTITLAAAATATNNYKVTVLQSV